MNANIANIKAALQHSDNITDADEEAVLRALDLLYFLSCNPTTAFSFTEIKSALHLPTISALTENS